MNEEFMPKGIKGFQKGHIVPDDIRKKISKAGKGKYVASRYTKERNKKISKGLKGRKVSKETREKIRAALLGKKQSLELIAKRVKGRRGYKHSQETLDKMAKTHKKRFKNYIYKTDESKRIRKSAAYKNWRESIFLRDDYTCQMCNEKGGCGHRVELHPHHIQNFAQYKDSRFLLKNGITLCIKCHKLFHKTYGKVDNNEKQIKEFLSIRC